jgi:hypothetical protein
MGAMMSQEKVDYLSYLLRLWRVRDGSTEPCCREGEPRHTDEGTAWRASLQSPYTRERKSFASLDTLFVYLRQQTGVTLDMDEDQARSTTQRKEERP